eukprot:6323623-Amphidinium_carterae.1
MARLGHPTRVQSELHKYTMDNVVYGSEQASLCRDIKKDLSSRASGLIWSQLHGKIIRST